MTFQQFLEQISQLIHDGKYEDAIHHLEKHSDEFNDNPDYYQHLAMLYIKNENREKAKHVLEKAVLLAPDNAVSQNNYGVVLYQDQEYEASRKCFETAVVLNNRYV